jgi:dUTP pyrophosphatase
MNIYVKYHNPKCKFESYGNWIDLKASETIEFKKFEAKLIDLGISVKLPKYYQANIVPRSSTIKLGLLQANHYGVVDGPDNKSNGYSGNNDRYKFSAFAIKNTIIEEGTRICQFEIRPTMYAPWYVKLRWIFNNKYKFIEVDDLGNNNRGGFGSTGGK